MKEYIFMMGMFLVSVFINVTVAGCLTALMAEYLLKRILKLEANSSETSTYFR